MHAKIDKKIHYAVPEMLCLVGAIVFFIVFVFLIARIGNFYKESVGALLFFAGSLAMLWAYRSLHTLRKKLEHALAEKYVLEDALAHSLKLATLGEMTGKTIHELNNPLMLVKEHAGWVQDLLSDEDPAKMLHHVDIEISVGKVIQHADRARDIVRNTMSFLNPGPLAGTIISVDELVEETLGFLSSDLRYRSIHVHKEFGGTQVRAKTEAEPFQQVLLNILKNAIDAAEESGTLWVQTGFDEQGRVFVSVRDNGKGIAKEHLATLFTPLFTTKPKGKGTGFGLSVSKAIMEKLGGTITAANAPEGGAIFTVTLLQHSA